MKISKEIQNLVLYDYKNTNLKVQEIALKHNLCRQSIRNIVLSNNECIREKKFNNKIKEKIIKEYNEGKSNKELSIKYNVHRCTIQRILKSKNIKLRTQNHTSRKKNLLNFTNGITNSKDAYILGLIYADGNLFRNAIEISLQKKDKNLLLDISNYVYGKNTLKYKKGRAWIAKNGKKYISKGQWRFTIISKKVSDILRKIGLCENKSLKIRFPKLDKKFISHFIRGYFDGDGCIFISKKYKGTNGVTIVSNYLFCEDLKKQIKNFLDINVSIQNKTKNVGAVSITGNKQIVKFMDWIYKDSDLKMKRKFEKYYDEYKKTN